MAHETLRRDDATRLPSNRMFGVVFTIAFFVIGMLPSFWGGGVRLWSMALAAGFMVLAIALPGTLAPLNRLWMRFGLMLHRIVNPIVLGVMYFLVITPTGLVMRLLGKRPLRLAYEREAGTYWVRRTPPGPSPQSLDRQF